MCKPIVYLFPLACFLLIISATGCNPSWQAQTSAADTLARVSKIQLIKQGGFPIHYNVKIEGVLPDTCTTFRNIDQRRKDNLFTINLIIKPHPGQKCSGSEAPFDVEVPLEMDGLPKGKYKVQVNNKETSFELEQDNEFD